jgi:hypothetical protein
MTVLCKNGHSCSTPQKIKCSKPLLSLVTVEKEEYPV